MAGKVCGNCRMVFSSSSNRLRHQRKIHGVMPIYTGTEQQEDNETLADEVQQQIDDENAEKDENEDGADDGDDKEDEEDNESEKDSGTEDEEIESPWREIIAEACDNTEMNIDTAESLLMDMLISEDSYYDYKRGFLL